MPQFIAANDIAEPLAGGPAVPRHDAVPGPYFEIFRAEQVSVTSILFTGGDWRWQLCAPTGAILARSSRYLSEASCNAAVTALQQTAGAAPIRAGRVRG